MNWLAAITKNRKARQDVSAFKSLLALPASGSFALPANARLAFRSVAGAVAGSTAATLRSASTRTIKAPALAAGAFTVLDHAERGTVVTAASGFEVLLDTGLGKFKKIGGA